MTNPTEIPDTHSNISLAFLFSSNIVDCLTAKDHLFYNRFSVSVRFKTP